MMRALLVAALVLVYPAALSADPSSDVKSLLDSKVSLVDLGLLKMHMYFDTGFDGWFRESSPEDELLSANMTDIEYDFDENRYNIRIMLVWRNGFGGRDLQAKWAPIVFGFIDNAFVSRRAALLTDEQSTSMYAAKIRQWFSYSGYSTESVDQVDWERFSDRFYVQLMNDYTVVVERKLLGRDLMYIQRGR